MKASRDLMIEDPLDWCLRQLSGGVKAGGQMPGYPMLLAFLDGYLTRCPAQDRAHLDHILFWKFSDLAALAELHDRVLLHGPRREILAYDKAKAYISQPYRDKNARQREIIIRGSKKLEQPVHTAFDSARPLANAKETIDDQPKAKKKAKTPSPETEGPDLDVTIFGPVVEPTKDVQKIPTTRRDLNVLALMYPAPLEDARTVDWGAFVHAMGYPGFSARHNVESAMVLEQAKAMAATEDFLVCFGEGKGGDWSSIGHILSRILVRLRHLRWANGG
ncbi:hypothetical protein DL766_004917 [Monosporascus sp. MC13-8B]|uniref:Uncharacterized protein n=1 Tax=Monosporascus cannonballus TaxID=155416 RepID=A0ABY0HKN2_9PEZI|nr:hypothetical protein DL763_010199 [Monosporascus cannonballus]RYO92787.1 hypothetical protein DL762_001493 [Monosporascus cannonballus]RYP30316.1 hypothetical protein DL766_004917 [Monosporascus sp. MC13-8B]